MFRQGVDAAPSLLLRFAKLLHCCAAVALVLIERTGAAPSLSVGHLPENDFSAATPQCQSMIFDRPVFQGIELTHMLQELHLIGSKLCVTFVDQHTGTHSSLRKSTAHPQ